MIMTKFGMLRFRFVLLLLLSLILADGVITEYIVYSGLGSELNPIMQQFLNEGHLIAIKIIGGFLCTFLLWDINRNNRAKAMVVSLLFIAFYTGVVYWNIAGIVISSGFLQ